MNSDERHPNGRSPTDGDKELDRLLDSLVSPTKDSEERVTSAVLARLVRRRRLVWQARTAAAVLVVAVTVASIIAARMAVDPQGTGPAKVVETHRPSPTSPVRVARPPGDSPVEAIRGRPAGRGDARGEARGEARRDARRGAQLLHTVRTASVNVRSRLLAEIMNSEPDAKEALRVVVTELPRRRALTIIDYALKSERPAVRVLGARALDNLSPDRAVDWFVGESRRLAAASQGDAQPLCDFLREGLQGLAESSLRAARRRLRRDLAADSDARERMIRALAETREAAAWPFLELAIEVRGPDVASIRAIGELGDRRGAPYLKRWLGLTGERGKAVVTALGKMPGREPIRTLLAAYRSRRATSTLQPGLGEAFRRALTARQGDVLELASAAATEGGNADVSLVTIELFPDRPASELLSLVERSPRRAQPRLLQAVGSSDSPARVEVLLTALENPSLHRAARRVLVTLARRDLGPRAARWRTWFTGSGREDSSTAEEGLLYPAPQDILRHPSFRPSKEA